jgi:hypothetical protein
VADDISGIGFSRLRAFLIWTAETLHCFMDWINNGTDYVKLSLKLYHMYKLRLRHQQMMAEAPDI